MHQSNVLKKTLSHLADNLSAQLKRYLAALEEINLHRSESRTDLPRELKTLEFVLGAFFSSREMRVADLASPEVKKAIAIKERLFPLGRPKLMLCVDGRVLAKHFAGLHGNSLRLTAGDSKEFVPRRSDGRLVLRDNSPIADMIRDAYVGTDVLFEVLDSHVGCAARGLEESDRAGHELFDKGLYRDVIRKKEKVRALQEFVAKTYQDTKRMHVVQTSFDPASGYCYMGLDTCLDESSVKKDGFTPAVLSQLVHEGKILSTHTMVEEENNPEIHAAFTHAAFDLDYERNYRESSLRFWEAIETMIPTALSPFERRLTEIYSHYSHEDYRSERREAAILMLANAFTGYLNNQKAEYLYREHDESVIAVTFSEKGPYAVTRSFSVDPNNPALSGQIKFTADLIRSNRKASRMSKPEIETLHELYPSLDEYAQSPAPVILFERLAIVRSDVDSVAAADWSDLATLPWMSMSDDEFAHYLESKVPDMTQTTARALMRLRARATTLYTPGKPATDSLLEGRIVPVWVLAGPHRETIALLPFVTAGYDVE